MLELEQSAGEHVHLPAALIYAALLHNKIDLEEGFSVFDQVSHAAVCTATRPR